MSDAWEDIQAIKSKRISLREKLQKRKKERQELLNLSGGSETPTITEPQIPTGASDSVLSACKPKIEIEGEEADDSLETELLRELCDSLLNLPVTASQLQASLKARLSHVYHINAIISLLNKFNTQQLISLSEEGGKVEVSSAEHVKLVAVINELREERGRKEEPAKEERTSTHDRSRLHRPSTHSPTPCNQNSPTVQSEPGSEEPLQKVAKLNEKDDKKKEKKASDIMSLLLMPSTREKETKKVGEEILELLSKPTAKERSLTERFKSNGAQVMEFCAHGTRDDCAKLGGGGESCAKLHFKKILQKHTDESLGDCSFLNTCFHMDTCKYVHYEVESGAVVAVKGHSSVVEAKVLGDNTILYPPQWIQCDLRYLDMTVLGKFAVIMADPPWDIHMELPYGTMSDDEMRHLGVPALQDNGLIFLWVTGRAMELGRECLQLWGYERMDEIIWVKTNQLQRIIRTGRTGHWLNHGKEHCLVGRKGDISHINRGLDCDVIVAEVRATSHKPDEIYGIIERLSPGTRKIELFGRPHNIQPNWVTLGNQLEGVRIVDPELIQAFRKRYPDGNCMVPPTT